MKKALMIFMGMSFSVAAQADVWCKGAVTDTWVDASGLLLVYTSWSPSALGLCRVTTQHNGIEPEVCNTWVSIALTATTTQKSTTLRYRNNDDCSTLAAYGNSPKPEYFMLGSHDE
ncbi:hypothetical protein LQM11_004441 [Vibrio parahaemolyticus]|nr:hypothetical protein [Vibrio parahaemolyticus]EIO4563802.1 hypothetical protein [Vibrio parahaemolyticus]MBM4859852.1 hypothetical protein [Vibrio parahaemolyticus]